MNVLMASTSYPENVQDWRGRFIGDMVDALAHSNEMKLSLWAPTGQIPDNVSDATTLGDRVWLQRLSQQGGIASLLRNRPVIAAGATMQLLARLGRCYRRRSADVCHVNWLQNALPLWGTRTPALITVLGSDFGLLRLPGMKALLRAMLRQRRAILAPNAEWMRPELERMFGDLAEVCTIPFGVDPAWFAVERHPLSDARNWLVVTRVTREKIGSLFEWGEGLFGADRQLHLFGPMQEDIRIPQWVNYHGATHPVELQRVWFAQTCGLISLSNHDEGRPQVVLEAMAAGLPVIVSDLSAHRDIVKHKGNGCIVAAPDELDLGLKWLEDPVQNMEVGNAARAFVSGTIGTWDDCAERYSDAYRKLLEPTL